MKSRLLIMENDQHVLDVLTFSLSREGYDVIRTTDGLDGLSLAEALSPSLIILDLQPPMDSAKTCVCLREEGVGIPILVLAKEQSEKYYLECGADSCVIKPFPIKNLLTAIKDALLVAATIPVIKNNQRKELGRIIIDPNQMRIFKDGVSLELSIREYDIVSFLTSEPGRVFSRDELLYHVWNYTGYQGDMRGVDVAVRRLREKIEDDPSHPAIIMTKRGKGYYLGLG